MHGSKILHGTIPDEITVSVLSFSAAVESYAGMLTPVSLANRFQTGF